MIAETAPILKRFVGQPLYNLVQWMTSSFTDVKLEVITHE